jgi:Mn2+/Fe2+ NRAMP family transporter
MLANITIKVDTYVGMAFSNLIPYHIILTVAVNLNANGKTDIDTAAQAAEALRPIAGQFASSLFSLGIVGTGLLALPVLAGSSAYAVGEALRRQTKGRLAVRSYRQSLLFSPLL